MSEEVHSETLESEAPQDSQAIDGLAAEATELGSEAASDVAPGSSAAAPVGEKAVPARPKKAASVPPSAPPPKPTDADIEDNDRLMAALAYFLWFLGSAIILLSPSLKAKPYLRYHAIQALGLSAVLAVVSFVLVVMAFVFCCIGVLLLIPFGVTIYYTIEAYQAKYFRIPVVTHVMMSEGWLKRD